MDDLVERTRMAAKILRDIGGQSAMTAAVDEAADALEAMREDAERLDWLSQLDVGICDLGYGDYQWYGHANPKPEHGMLGLRAAIDAARKTDE